MAIDRIGKGAGLPGGLSGTGHGPAGAADRRRGRRAGSFAGGVAARSGGPEPGPRGECGTRQGRGAAVPETPVLGAGVGGLFAAGRSGVRHGPGRPLSGRLEPGAGHGEGRAAGPVATPERAAVPGAGRVALGAGQGRSGTLTWGAGVRVPHLESIRHIEILFTREQCDSAYTGGQIQLRCPASGTDRGNT